MKKILYFGIIIAGAVLLHSCNDEPDFPGLDEKSKFTNVQQLEYTLTAADYKTIAANKTNEKIADSLGIADELAAIGENGYFTPTVTVADFLPVFLQSKWYSIDDKSRITVNYKKQTQTPEYVNDVIAAETYKVTNSDYATVWGNGDTNYFTPTKSPKNNLSKLLNSAVSDAEEGDYLLVSYRYSDKEPGDVGEVVLKEMNEDFGTVTVYQSVALDGWVNYGGEADYPWQGRSYNGNFYTQIGETSNSATKDLDAWLITPKFDLSDATSPVLSFDVNTGSNNGATLQVLISEDFNGSDPTTATWTDVSKNFFIPTLPASGYGVLTPAGIMNLSRYQSVPFYIAFRFVSPIGTKGAYQIDNVQVGDVNTVIESTLLFEDFESCPSTDKPAITLTGWTNTGANPWYGAAYNNVYAEANAYKMGELLTYLITPKLSISSESTYFTFDVNPRNYAGECLTVLISENFSGDPEAATWVDVTQSFDIPKETTSNFVSVGIISLLEYANKDIYVAFRYYGNESLGLSTQMRIDNVKVYTLSRGAARMSAAAASYVGTVVERNAVYQYNGATWMEASDIVMLDAEDYTEMGGTNPNFSSSFAPDDYIPTYLSMNYPYAKEGDVKTVVYEYYASSVTSVRANEYTYTKGVWTNNEIQEVSEQFTRTNGEWVYSPGILIELPADRYNEFATEFMQNVVEYVGQTYGTEYYQTGYTNAEFYYGFSHYYNNVNFSINYWRNRNEAGPTAYGDLSDEELEALQYERLPEAFKIGLELMYPDAAPADTGSMVYTVYFALYTGANITTYNYMIQFEVVGKGQFEYVEDSLGPIE